MPHVAARTVPVRHGIARPGRLCPITGRGTRTLGLAGVVAVVLATLMAVVAPVSAAAAVPATNGPIPFTSDRHGNREISVMDADGTRIAVRITRDGNSETSVMSANGINVVVIWPLGNSSS